MVNASQESLWLRHIFFIVWIPTTTFDHPLVRQSECRQVFQSTVQH
jgi:hypothetical protein